LIDFRLDKAAEGLLNNYFDQVFHDFKLPAVEGSVQDKYTQYDKTKRTMVQDPYKLWIAKNEKDVPTKEEVQQLLKHFEGTTLFSVVIPTYNTDGKYLRECLDYIKSTI
jgi:signal recognition particle receptor subunit beta